MYFIKGQQMDRLIEMCRKRSWLSWETVIDTHDQLVSCNENQNLENRISTTKQKYKAGDSILTELLRPHKIITLCCMHVV